MIVDKETLDTEKRGGNSVNKGGKNKTEKGNGKTLDTMGGGGSNVTYCKG